MIQKTDTREQINNFNMIPYPDRSLVNYDLYMKFPNEASVTNCIAIQGTRGCPFSCAYCHQVWPKKHIVRSAENIINEIKIYYDMGVKRFAFVDDIFNMNVLNSRRFFELLLQKNMKIQIFFPNGVRGDILNKDYIDLMMEAGTVYVAMALETASPRLQKLIGKNLKIEKLYENLSYICSKYQDVITALFMMVGFPTETEKEALMTYEFLKELKWVHFPKLHALTIYPKTNMEKIALSNGISREDIVKSASGLYHELPKTLPFKNKNFVTELRVKLVKEYLLNKDRLKQVLPGQTKYMTEKELVILYNSIFRTNYKKWDEFLKFFRIKDTIQIPEYSHCKKEETIVVHNLNSKIQKYFTQNEAEENAIKILFLDATHEFDTLDERTYRNSSVPPLGHMYLATYLQSNLKGKVKCKLCKAYADYNSYEELRTIIEEFNPDLFGIRCMTCYKSFFHETVSKIREWGYMQPVIAGGPHATSCYDEVLKDPNVDIVILGEGEITFKELVQEIINNNKQIPSKDVLLKIKGICFDDSNINNS